MRYLSSPKEKEDERGIEGISEILKMNWLSFLDIIVERVGVISHVFALVSQCYSVSRHLFLFLLTAFLSSFWNWQCVLVNNQAGFQ